MSLELTLNKPQVRSRMLIVGAAIISAVVLPQVFHIAGVALGLGPAIGETLLPMHLPVLLAALLAGPIAGSISGILSPLISFSISGMPPSPILPYIIIELAAYGIIAGFLRTNTMPVLVKLVLAQVGGRVLRLAAMLITVILLGNHSAGMAGVSAFIVNGLPGIVLQLCVLPLLISRIERAKESID